MVMLKTQQSLVYERLENLLRPSSAPRDERQRDVYHDLNDAIELCGVAIQCVKLSTMCL